jgi:hypothetical protein
MNGWLRWRRLITPDEWSRSASWHRIHSDSNVVIIRNGIRTAVSVDEATCPHRDHGRAVYQGEKHDILLRAFAKIRRGLIFARRRRTRPACEKLPLSGIMTASNSLEVAMMWRRFGQCATVRSSRNEMCPVSILRRCERSAG